MSISILQERIADGGSATLSSLSLAFSGAVTVGSSIHVPCTSADTNASYTCADSVNGSYGTALDNVDVSADVQRVAHFGFGSTAAGTPNVTITPNVSTSFVGISIREVGSSSGLDVHIAHTNISVGTGADAVTSTTNTPSVQPGLISALCVDTSNEVTPSSGTGFTPGTTGWGFGGTAGAATESIRYTSTAAKAATFTSTDGTGQIVVVAAWFKESGGGGAAPQPFPWQLQGQMGAMLAQ